MLEEQNPQNRLDELRVGDNSLLLYRDGYELYAARLGAIDGAQESIYLESSIWRDDEAGRALKQHLSQKAVPSNTMLVDRITCSSFTQCLQAGMRLYGSRKGELRSKTCTIDGQWSTIGSARLDLLSSVVNYELNIEIYEVAFAAQMQDLFASDIADAFELSLTNWLSRPWHRMVIHANLRTVNELKQTLLLED